MSGSLDSSVLPSVHHALPPYGSPSSFLGALRSPPAYLRTAASVVPQPSRTEQVPLPRSPVLSDSSAASSQRPLSAQKTAQQPYRPPQSPTAAFVPSSSLASSTSALQLLSPLPQQPRAAAISPQSQQARIEWLQSALAKRSPSQTQQRLPLLDGAEHANHYGDDLAASLQTVMPVSPPSSAIYGAPSKQWMASLSAKAATATAVVSELAATDGSTAQGGGSYSGHLLARSHVSRPQASSVSSSSLSTKAQTTTMMPSMALRRESAHMPPPPRSQQHGQAGLHERERPVVRVTVSVPDVATNHALHG